MVVKREYPADTLAAAADPRVSAAFPDLRIAGPLDDVEAAPLEITMSDDWNGYMNIAVISKLIELSPTRVTHVQLLPDKAKHQVIFVPCEATDYGATEIRFRPTENGANVNLRLPCQALKVNKLANRVRIFKVTTCPGADGLSYLAFSTKAAQSRPVRVLKKEEGETRPQS